MSIDAVRLPTFVGLLLTFLLFASPPARAADSLLGSFNGSFRFYHLFDRPNGETDIEEIQAITRASDQPDLPKGMTGILSLFEGPADAIVRWRPHNMPATPLHNSSRTEVAIILQGDLILSLKNGKEQRVHAGEVTLSEDYAGTGHSGRCEPVNGAMGCVQLVLFPKSDQLLRGIERKGAGFCAADCNRGGRQPGS